MRLLLSLLFLSAAVPALASQPEDNEARMAREARAETEPPPREERVERPEPPQRVQQERGERPQRAQRPQRGERPERTERPERIASPDATPQGEPEDQRDRRQRHESPRGIEDGTVRPADGVADWRWQERRSERDRRRGAIPPAISSPVLGEAIIRPQTDRAPADWQRGDRPITDRPITDRHATDRLRDRVTAESWRREWRQDRRYDWRRHRDRDRSRFRVSIYIDPFGWNYRRWNLGWNLNSDHYSSRYWIDDPWEYRLPPAYGPYRWVRYYDDALLVDLRSGRVVDVIHGFFW